MEAATKQKQRQEILKLRRALRESVNPSSTFISLSNLPFPTSSSLPLISPSSNPNANILFPTSPGSSTLRLDEYFDDEVEDPELETRWGRVNDLVEGMRRKGEKEVERKVELGGVKVLHIDGGGIDDTREEGRGAVGDESVGEISLDEIGMDELGDVSAEI
jgi:hypothetical protein